MTTSPLNNPQPVTEPLLEPTTPPQRKLPVWRLWVPLLFQAALVLAVPGQDIYTYAFGKPVVLQTDPVDPYDLLRGYSQTLSYDISNLGQLPGAKSFAQQTEGTVYVVLEAPANGNVTPPKPWKAVRISGDRPTNLAANQVAIKGHYNGRRILYGLETYYMAEDQRQQINSEINQLQRQGQRPFVVETKVDASGNAVAVSLWVGDRNYRF
jgi:uncharacterized membrane-anchored protein